MSALIFDKLIREEGMRLKPYLDCCGRFWRECQCEKKGALTIGVGRNLDDLGLSLAEVKFMLKNDVERVTQEADKKFPWFAQLDTCRQDVILSMIFNLGVSRFSGFKGMINAIEQGDYERSADEMLDSTWAKEVPARAAELASSMRSGK